MARILAADDAAILESITILKGGGLVVFPTETVYGLGANALDRVAVAGIFKAKGRPASNPVIVHVANTAKVSELAEINETAEAMIKAFWPGALTVVLPRKPIVPDIVTAGGNTVAVRMPDHPIALRLLLESGLALAAPSANHSESLSPTRAQHAADSLGDQIDLILDGGPCRVGLESTVLDVTCNPPRILRPGMITANDILRKTGIVVETLPAAKSSNEPARAPGQMLRHYAPRTRLVVRRDLRQALGQYHGRLGLLFCGDIPSECVFEDSVTKSLPLDPAEYAEGLYDALHFLDNSRVDTILVQEPPRTLAWAAIWDRLNRASSS
jgi:L-threonylcarbamoyladenylate synthase